MEFLVKVQCSDALRQREVIQDLRDGLKLIVHGGDPDCEYLEKLAQVRIKKHTQPKKVVRRSNASR